jgi:hypothetical protein
MIEPDVRAVAQIYENVPTWWDSVAAADDSERTIQNGNVVGAAWEGDAPAEPLQPRDLQTQRLGGSLALPGSEATSQRMEVGMEVGR